MLPYSGIYSRVVCMWTDVSEELTSIFRVEIQPNKKQLEAGGYVIRSSETSGHIRTIQRYITEDVNVYNYRCENLKSYCTMLLLDQNILYA
jgi:hypothetical protein